MKNNKSVHIGNQIGELIENKLKKLEPRSSNYKKCYQIKNHIGEIFSTSLGWVLLSEVKKVDGYLFDSEEIKMVKKTLMEYGCRDLYIEINDTYDNRQHNMHHITQKIDDVQKKYVREQNIMEKQLHFVKEKNKQNLMTLGLLGVLIGSFNFYIYMNYFK